MPLERNTVRFVDNFSAGTRGAVSAEHFLRAGWAVIFLHRRFSLEPFLRHLSKAPHILSLLQPTDTGVQCNSPTRKKKKKKKKTKETPNKGTWQQSIKKGGCPLTVPWKGNLILLFFSNLL